MNALLAKMSPRVALLAAVCGGVWSACGSGSAAPFVNMTGPFHLAAMPEELLIAPSATQVVVFQLLDEQEHVVPQHVVQFAIVSAPGASGDTVKGATLSPAEGSTDGAGKISITISAGLETSFLVRATTNLAPTVEIPVFVSAGLHGNADVAPALSAAAAAAAGAAGEPAPVSVALRVYDNQPCAVLDLTNPDHLPEAFRPERTVGLQDSYVFTGLRLDQTHAVTGAAKNAAGIVQYFSCIDLPGSTLLDGRTVRVFLPLALRARRVAGVFNVLTSWTFEPRPVPLDGLVATWGALSRCPSDPAQLWIDCTIDALGGPSGADPLDCRPADDEGPVAQAITMRRGVLATAGRNALCRGALDSQGRPSLDAALADKLTAAAPDTLAILPDLAEDLDRMFDSIRTLSRLEIESEPGAAGRVLIHHRLASLEFDIHHETVKEPLDLLGAPVLDAWYIPGTLASSELVVPSHGFASRWGTAMHHAFVTHALGGRGLPAGEKAFVDQLMSRFTVTVGNQQLHGCEALDQLLCSESGQAAGCLAGACQNGATALASILGASFGAFDGDDLDFQLAGTAPLVDLDGNFEIDRLGLADDLGTAPGLWLGELRTRSGNHALTGSWIGARQQPQH